MIVFVDMDGVVSDFDGHYLLTYGKFIQDQTNEEQSRFWDSECVSRRFFANSPAIAEGIWMVRTLVECGVEVCFLTSTGGQLQHVDIAKQKLDFLQRNDLGNLPVAFATGTKSKASFAHRGSILIDDRMKVVDAFTDGGGLGILFDRDDWREIVDDIRRIVGGVKS